MLRAAIMALSLVCGCRAHGSAGKASLELPRNAADQARRFQLPRTPTGDTDRDGVLDRDDACPDELEFYDGKVDNDGCPDNGRGVVQIDEDSGAIELAFGHELEFYDDDNDVFRRHQDTLQQVAWFLRAHPRFTALEIIQVGNDRVCTGFDCDRNAESIRFFFMSHGIDERRLHVSTRLGLGMEPDPAFPRGPTSRVELAVGTDPL